MYKNALLPVTFDHQSFRFGDQRDFLISGEFHYFRVPRTDWRRRMRLFRETGGNTLSTYVPWLLHEPEEGTILFDDCEWRDLSSFLTMAEEEGLYVIVKPGPYVYTEMVNGGIPRWLWERYPSLMACRRNGEHFRASSYTHPLFLEKIRPWYCAVAEIIRPHLVTNGGTVIMVQTDNEATLTHLGNGSEDYNPETMGFGQENGYYSQFLTKRYGGNLAALNAAYGTAYSSFSAVDIRSHSCTGASAARMERDYNDCYRASIGVYFATLAGILRENGIDVTLIHNPAGAGAVPYLREAIAHVRDDDFFFGIDSYYNLNYTWGSSHPTVDMFAERLYGADLLKNLGYPFAVLEMQAGNIVQIPPVLREDLYAWFMTHLAVGLRGVNYYIFTGGENHADSGTSADIYDYCAPVSADGEVRRSYGALTDFHSLLHANRWLCTSERRTSVQIGFEWQTMRCGPYADLADAHRSTNAGGRMKNGLLLTLLSTKYAGGYTELTSGIDQKKPLLIESPDTMSSAAQEEVVRFVEEGGCLLLLSGAPMLDEAFAPCTALADTIGRFVLEVRENTPSVQIGVHRVYDVEFGQRFARCPEDAEIVATSIEGNEVLGFRVRRGRGQIVMLSGSWSIANFGQAEVLETLLASFGAIPSVACSCRTVYATQFTGPEGRGIFLINLYTGQQETDVIVYDVEESLFLGHFVLAPMEIRLIPY